MVIDSSAIVAMILEEASDASLRSKLDGVPEIYVAAPIALEASMVLTPRLKRDGAIAVRRFLTEIGAQVVPFTEEHFRAAHRAFELYGKGRHPAALNFGDCMSYAVAKLAELPLLFTGDDFTKTDVLAA